MSEGMICIDFGNSYTKVGVRRDKHSSSRVLTDENLLYDDQLYFCIPTLAASRREGRKLKWFFGDDVVRKAGSGDGLTVYRNWKPLFFEDASGELPLVQSRRLSKAQIAALHELGLTEEQLASLPGILQQAKPKARSTGVDYKAIGAGFFSWLRAYIEPLCKEAGLPKISDLPTRITTPAFGSKTQAEDLLNHILQDTGWNLDDSQPALREPIANAIGIFSGAANAVWQVDGKEFPNYAKLFSRGTLFEAIRNQALGYRNDRIYWTLVLDVGGYTLDCAMVGFDLEDMESPIRGTHQEKERMASFSYAMGVHNLDDEVLEQLSPKSQEAMRALMDDHDHSRLEAFHRQVYKARRAYQSLTHRGVRIGWKEEGEAIQDCLQQFAHRIAELAMKFMEQQQYDHIDELILTGGGFNIPTLRDIVSQQLSEFLQGDCYVPVQHRDDQPDLPPGQLPILQEFVRGATALGGSSVFFDYAD